MHWVELSMVTFQSQNNSYFGQDTEMPKDLIIIQVEDNIYVALSNKLSHQRNPHIYTLQTSARFK